MKNVDGQSISLEHQRILSTFPYQVSYQRNGESSAEGSNGMVAYACYYIGHIQSEAAFNNGQNDMLVGISYVALFSILG